MVAQFPVIIVLSLTWFLNPLQAVISVDFNETLIGLKTHLSGGAADFDIWTNRMSLELNKEQQERLAWNVPWFDILQEKNSPEELQNQLKPSNLFKLRMWLSFYNYLRKSKTLRKIVLVKFALELRKLKPSPPEKWSDYLQNMLQSLPRSLRILIQSRWLCLRNKSEMFYVTSGYHLELGANDHCSLWQVQEVKQDYLLLLVNFCNEDRYFFINLLEDYNDSYQLLRPTNYMNNTFCVLRGLAHFKETSQVSKLDLGCQWQPNDCSYLPDRLIRELQKT